MYVDEAKTLKTYNPDQDKTRQDKTNTLDPNRKRKPGRGGNRSKSQFEELKTQ